jgi:hypothetical protein
MSKLTSNLIKKYKTQQALNPPIAVRSIITQFQRHPGYALARLKRADTKRLTALALILGKRYKQLDDGDETKAAMGTLIAWIRNLVAERKKVQRGDTDT